MSVLKRVLLVLLSCFLVACHRQPSADWLVGQWRSESWDVVYDFDQQGETWIVKTEQGLLFEEMSLTYQDDQLVLTAPDGTKLIIEQLTDRQLTLYQAPAEGLVGLTAQVEFDKLKP